MIDGPMPDASATTPIPTPTGSAGDSVGGAIGPPESSRAAAVGANGEIAPLDAASGANLAPANADADMPAEQPTSASATPPELVKLSVMDRVDRFISRLSTRSHFWQRVTSLIWMPYAFRSGIRMKRVDQNTFSAVLPFRRANRNWYNAMAGAALLANSEIAGGMYVFGVCGGEYTVVCKHLEYKFLRPCHGPAVYRITPREDLNQLLSAGREFNITLDMEIYQESILPETVRPAAEAMLPKAVGDSVASKPKRVGRCTATFHVTPKMHQRKKGRTIR